MSEVGVDGLQVGVGEERVMPPYREQRVGVVGVLDAAHDQAGGDLVASGERGVLDLGDLGVGNQFPGVGVVTAPGECRASSPCPSILSMAWVMRGLRVITSENSMPAVTAAPMTALLPNAESPRAMILPVARRRGRW